MTVKLLHNYGSYLAGAYVTLPDSTESALIAQGLATAAGTSTTVPNTDAGDAYTTIGGNTMNIQSSGLSTPTLYQGPLMWPNVPIGAVALTTFETNGVAQTAGTFNLAEIYVPYAQTWTGVAVLNGTVVGTDNLIVAVYGTNGALLANSAVAGTLSAGASAFQNIPFTTAITLPAGRYFIGVQASGTTATLRHILAANGVNVCTGTVAGTFGTVPATITAPATFTTAVGVIAQLYV